MKKKNEIGLTLLDVKVKVITLEIILFPYFLIIFAICQWITSKYKLIWSKFLKDFADDVLGDDDVFILESIAEAKKNDEENLRVKLILR